jgi:hypothetical protein
VTEKKQRQLLVVDLGPLKADIARCAKDAGMLPTPWAREALEQAVRAAGVTPRTSPPAPARKRKLDGEAVRFDVRLLPAEHAQLVSASAAAGLSRTEYMARLLMSPTASVPGPKTLATLAESTYQLQRLGGNFNQLLKHLNDKPGQLTSADRQLIRDVAQATQEHVKKAARFLADYSATRRTGSGGWRKPKKG